MNPVIVRIEHIRAADLCASGARAWFAAHNISWSDFLAHGIAAETLEATSDAFALRVTAIARKEAANG